MTMPSRITGGLDTHLDVHVAALDERGGLLGVESCDTTPAGYSRLLEWLTGVGSQAAGLSSLCTVAPTTRKFVNTQSTTAIRPDRVSKMFW